MDGAITRVTYDMLGMVCIKPCFKIRNDVLASESKARYVNISRLPIKQPDKGIDIHLESQKGPE